jgi:hypothetical protein
MPRVRKPSPERWTKDLTIVRSAQALINTLASYDSGELRMASRCIDEFVNAPVPQPKPRTRKPKAQPEQPALAGAAANG